MAPKQQKITSMKELAGSLATRLRVAAVRPDINGYIPHQKQEDFHTSLAKGKLFLGGNRSGKTVGGCTEDVWWLTHSHPYRTVPMEPIRGRCVSVDFTQGVEKIVRPEIARWMPASKLHGGSWTSAWDKETRTLTMKDGGFLEFMSYDQHLDKFAGTSRHFIHFDEEPPHDIFIECKARLIDTGGSWWITMTPVEGMTWVYDDVYMAAKTDPDIHVVEIEMTENPHLNEGEIASFLSGLSKDERAAREKGHFVQIGGLVYKQFDGDKHIIQDDEFTIPDNWLRVNAMDHGFNNPTAWLWAAVSPDGDVVIYDEHYEDGKLVGHHAQAVHQKNALYGITPAYNVGDPSIRNTDPITGTSIQLEYIEYGIPIVLGVNDVQAGINRVGRYLSGVNGKPKLYIHKRCRNLLWELPRYRWSTWATKKHNFEKNRKEDPHKKNDHAVDALRYLIASRPEADDGSSIPEFFPPVGARRYDAKYRDVDQELSAPRREQYLDSTLGSEW